MPEESHGHRRLYSRPDYYRTQSEFKHEEQHRNAGRIFISCRPYLLWPYFLLSYLSLAANQNLNGKAASPAAASRPAQSSGIDLEGMDTSILSAR